MKLFVKMIMIFTVSILLQACSKDVKVDGATTTSVPLAVSTPPLPEKPILPDLLLSASGKIQNNAISTIGAKGAEQDFYFSLNATANLNLSLEESGEVAAGCDTEAVTKNYLWLTMKDATDADNAEPILPGMEFQADAAKNYILVVQVKNLGTCTNYQLNFIANQI